MFSLFPVALKASTNNTLMIITQVTVFSLQVIRRFVQTAENRAEEASKEAKSSKGDMANVEDLDMLYTPER